MHLIDQRSVSQVVVNSQEVLFVHTKLFNNWKDLFKCVRFLPKGQQPEKFLPKLCLDLLRRLCRFYGGGR